MNGEPMNDNNISTGQVRMKSGEVLTEADFERMALEVETADIDVERLADRQRRGVGRPALGDGVSPVLQIRLDEQTRQRLAERAKKDHTTASGVAQDAIQAWLAS
jgi:hypothetical protein